MDEPKKTKKQKAENKRSLADVFNDYKGEFKKIIWPSPQELAKKTVTVIIACAIVGVIIIAFDGGFAFLLEKFTNLLG